MTTAVQLTAEKQTEARRLVKYVLDGGGEVVLETAQKLLLARWGDMLAALSPPTPEDVARDHDAVREALTTRPSPSVAVVAGLDRLRDGAARAQALGAQLPEGMKHCTILLKECAVGHGWLTATNWADHGCPTCALRDAESQRDAAYTSCKTLESERDAARQEAATLRTNVAELETVARLAEEERDLAVDIITTSDMEATHGLTPAPAGLLEAVEKAIREIVADISDRRGLNNEWRHIEDDVQSEIRAAWAGIILAAYDAAKGGEATGPGDEDEGEGDFAARFNAVQNTLTEKARKWDAAVERHAAQVAEARAARNRVAANAVEHAVTWVLYGDTPPSGPGGGETLDDSGPEHVCGEEGTECQKCQRPGLESTHVEPVVLGSGPFTMNPDVAARAVERTHRTVTESQRPALTPESLAAVVEALSDLVTMVEEDDAFNNPAKEPDRYAALFNAKEVLRRALFGEAPRILLESRVVDVLATSRATHLRRASEEPLGSSLKAEHGAMADACTQVATRLGLTLPSGDTKPHLPSCPQTLECALPEWKCTCPETRAAITDVTTPRARIAPTPTPEEAPLPPQRLWTGSGTRPTPEMPVLAQPAPAAPEVAWEQDGSRVLADGTYQFLWAGEWQADTVGTYALLARALAEAKRALLCEHGREKDYCAAEYEAAQERAARKAAEAMRERAERALIEHRDSLDPVRHSERRRDVEQAAQIVRALEPK